MSSPGSAPGVAKPADPAGPGRGFPRRLAVFLEAIKVTHSIFALPFAISAAFLAARGLPESSLLLKVVAAVVLARTAAMAFNRWADASIDSRNPRTVQRAIPAGLLSKRFMAAAAGAASLGFVAVCATINPLTIALSPVVLAVLLGYSYTKRFTSLSHVVLGAALGLSPPGAWVAVRGEIEGLPFVLGLAVLFWTAGFDIIYACQDVDFDRAWGLRSLPSRLGIGRALIVSRMFHVLTMLLLATVGVLADLGWIYAGAVGLVGVLLAYEQSLVRSNDLSRVNVAFFTLNGMVSLVFMAGVMLETVI